MYTEAFSGALLLPGHGFRISLEEHPSGFQDEHAHFAFFLLSFSFALVFEFFLLEGKVIGDLGGGPHLSRSQPCGRENLSINTSWVSHAHPG
jgi:hypothetical protein